MLVGDVDAFVPSLEAAGVGRIVIERGDGPVAAGPSDEVAQPGPVEDDGETGPMAGAEEPAVSGLDRTPADDGDAAPGDRPAVIDRA